MHKSRAFYVKPAAAACFRDRLLAVEQLSLPTNRCPDEGFPTRTSYLGRYRREAILPYLFLVIATLSQLAVPRMVRNIIDAVTNGVIAKAVLTNLDKIPAQFMAVALPKILDFRGLPNTWTQDQLVAEMTTRQNNAPNALLTATAAIPRNVRPAAGWCPPCFAANTRWFAHNIASIRNRASAGRAASGGGGPGSRPYEAAPGWASTQARSALRRATSECRSPPSRSATLASSNSKKTHRPAG